MPRRSAGIDYAWYVSLNSSTLCVHVHPHNILHAHVQFKKNGVGLATIDLSVKIRRNLRESIERQRESNGQ